MPELPEVEQVRRSLCDGPLPLPGRTVQDLRVLRPAVVDGNPDELRQLLCGAVCRSIERHGKYLFFCFQPSHATHPHWLAVHLRMTGRLMLLPEHQAPNRHVRLLLLFDQGLTLHFEDPRGFGRAWLVEDPAVVTARLGPDALQVDAAGFLRRLTAVRRQLKPLLLDQSVVAGIGNIYADEILFRAGLHPRRTSHSLSEAEATGLYRTIHQVLSQAVAMQGANIDGVFKAGRYPVAVYGRVGLPCSRCGTKVVKERVGQRGTSFCPACQPLVSSTAGEL